MKQFYLFWFFIFLFSVSCNAQSALTEKIDSLLDESFNQFSNVDLLNALKDARKAYDLSEEISYSRGIVNACLAMAKVTGVSGPSEKTLEFLEKAKSEPYFETSLKAQIESHRLRGRVFGDQKLYEFANSEFLQQLKLSEKLKDPEVRKIGVFMAYQNLAFNFQAIENSDSALYYLKAQKDILKEIAATNPEWPGLIMGEVTTHISFSETHLSNDDLDSADIYYRNALKMMENYQIPYKYPALKIKGNIEAVKENNQEALNYYQLALENTRELQIKNGEKDLNLIIGEFIGESQGGPHLSRYRELRDSIEAAEKRNMGLIVDYLVSREEKQQKKYLNKLIIIFIPVLLLFLTALVTLRFISKNRKYKLKTVRDELNEKEKLHQALKEIDKNQTYSLLVQFAKENDPRFIVLYEMTYPDIIARLKELNPNIKTSQLTFIGYILMGFSTTEIAEYTYVTLRAVQIRKNRLRKKYNIDSDDDLKSWFQALESE